MLYLRHVLPSGTPGQQSVTLAFDHRRKSRLRTSLDDGTEVALLLPRGTVLRDGDTLASDDGWAVTVHAAPELVSTATTIDPVLLARAAYHLGNRHIPLQIEKERVSYEHDHVLDDLARRLGLEVTVEEKPFEPEAGSYTQGHHRHDHRHDHDHDHDPVPIPDGPA